MNDDAMITFWQAQRSEMEGRARAAGQMVQTSATLAVTAVAGGLLAAGVDALQAPAIAVIVALIVWLLALIACLNWAEMKVLARKRDIADNEIAKLLQGQALMSFNRLRDTGAKVDFFTKIAIGAVVIICVLAFGTIFVIGVQLGAGLGALSDLLRWALPILAGLTVAAAVYSARERIRALH